MVPRDPRELTPASLSWSGPDVAFLASGGLHVVGGRGGGEESLVVGMALAQATRA